MRLNRLLAFAVAAPLVLGGCEAGEEVARESRAAEPDTADLPAPTPGTLAPINRSGVRGTAALEEVDDARMLRLEVQGMEPGARYSAHVHEGRCVDGGPIRLPLGRIEADEDGTGRTRMRLAPDRLPAEADLFVQVHATDDRAVACADIER